jgi:hypothetical protein
MSEEDGACVRLEPRPEAEAERQRQFAASACNTPRSSHVKPTADLPLTHAGGQMVDVGGKRSPTVKRSPADRSPCRAPRCAGESGAVKKAIPAGRPAGRDHGGEADLALIPLCHPLPLSSVQIELTPNARGYASNAFEPRRRPASRWRR